MVTVGELYKKVWQEAWDRQVPGGKGISFTDEAHRCLDAAVPGLWDAEVLECECKKDDFECEAFYPVTRSWRDLGLGYGDRVRVIVLPRKGE